MRILIPTGGFPPEVGGPATYVPKIGAALVERGHTVQVITLARRASGPDSAYPFRLFRLEKSGGRGRRWLSSLKQLDSLLNGSDLVFVNGLLIETALANLRHRRPMVAKVVGDIAWERARDKGWVTDSIDAFQQRRYGWPIEVRRWLRSWALRQMEAIVVPSAYLGKIVAGWGVDPARIRIIYNAFEPPQNPPPAVAVPLKTGYRLVTVCRLVNWKGVDELLEVVAQLPEVGLLVVGDGPERARLEALARRLGLGERVHFAGQVAKEEVPAYLQAADLFVLNSRYEGLPHVVLEALAAGKPVVATAVGGTPEVVEDGVNGYLVPAGDQTALRAAIQKILAGGPKALKPELSEKFSYPRMIKETATLLENRGQLSRPGSGG